MIREVYDREGNLIQTETVDDLPMALTPVELVQLFTPAELLALETSTSLAVVAFRSQFFAAIVPIELTDPRFVAALAIMQQMGILSAERVQAIKENRKP